MKNISALFLTNTVLQHFNWDYPYAFFLKSFLLSFFYEECPSKIGGGQFGLEMLFIMFCQSGDFHWLSVWIKWHFSFCGMKVLMTKHFKYSILFFKQQVRWVPTVWRSEEDWRDGLGQCDPRTPHGGQCSRKRGDMGKRRWKEGKLVKTLIWNASMPDWIASGLMLYCLEYPLPMNNCHTYLPGLVY